jgi:hypothetical protein
MHVKYSFRSLRQSDGDKMQTILFSAVGNFAIVCARQSRMDTLDFCLSALQLELETSKGRIVLAMPWFQILEYRILQE